MCTDGLIYVPYSIGFAVQFSDYPVCVHAASRPRFSRRAERNPHTDLRAPLGLIMSQHTWSVLSFIAQGVSSLCPHRFSRGVERNPLQTCVPCRIHLHRFCFVSKFQRDPVRVHTASRSRFEGRSAPFQIYVPCQIQLCPILDRFCCSVQRLPRLCPRRI